MTFSPNLDQMTPEQLRALAAQALQLQSQVEAMRLTQGEFAGRLR